MFYQQCIASNHSFTNTLTIFFVRFAERLSKQKRYRKSELSAYGNFWKTCWLVNMIYDWSDDPFHSVIESQ